MTMTDAQYEDLLADFKRRGGKPVICPPACLSPIQGYVPRDEHRSALSAYEAAKKPRYKLRQALRNEAHPHHKDDQMERERFSAMGKQSQIAAKERKEKKDKITVSLSGIPRVRRTNQTMSYPVRDRSPLQVVQFAKREVLMREDKGVIYIQLLDKHRQPIGASVKL